MENSQYACDLNLDGHWLSSYTSNMIEMTSEEAMQIRSWLERAKSTAMEYLTSK